MKPTESLQSKDNSISFTRGGPGCDAPQPIAQTRLDNPKNGVNKSSD